MAFCGSETSQLNWWPPHCTYSGMCYYSVIYSQFSVFPPAAFQGSVNAQSILLKVKIPLRDLMGTDLLFKFPPSEENHSFINQTVNLSLHPSVSHQDIILSVKGK